MKRTDPRKERRGPASEPGQHQSVIAIEDLPDLAMGAAFLGTGGGGDPYVGRLMAEEALRQYGPVELLPLDAVPDDAFIVPVGNMAPRRYSLRDSRRRVAARRARETGAACGTAGLRHPCRSKQAV